MRYWNLISEIFLYKLLCTVRCFLLLACQDGKWPGKPKKVKGKIPTGKIPKFFLLLRGFFDFSGFYESAAFPYPYCIRRYCVRVVGLADNCVLSWRTMVPSPSFKANCWHVEHFLIIWPMCVSVSCFHNQQDWNNQVLSTSLCQPHT